MEHKVQLNDLPEHLDGTHISGDIFKQFQGLDAALSKVDPTGLGLGPNYTYKEELFFKPKEKDVKAVRDIEAEKRKQKEMKQAKRLRYMNSKYLGKKLPLIYVPGGEKEKPPCSE